MPLLIPVAIAGVVALGGTAWLTKDAVHGISKDLIKLTLVAGVAYVAWINRDKISGALKL